MTPREHLDGRRRVGSDPAAAGEPEARPRSFAQALRAAAPRPRADFVELLERQMRERIAASEPEWPADVRIRVLVVQDDRLVREGLIRDLERDPGIEVVGEADNGIAAMEPARRLKPDVMVLGLGDAVVLERLRAELPEIRSLVMIADESPWSLLDAVAAGAAGYLSQRTTGEELRRAVITIHGGGSVMAPELADGVLREFSGSAQGDSLARMRLAARELEMVRRMVDGLTENERGGRRFGSPRPVRPHVAGWRPRLGRWLAAILPGGGGSAQ